MSVTILMGRSKRLVASLGLLVAACSEPGPGTPPPSADTAPSSADSIVYTGARLIIGDGRVIENGAFVVSGGEFAAVGDLASLSAPAGAAEVDLTGRTVMPALIDTHVHMSTTRDALIEDLRRRAAQGVGTAMSLGSDGEGAPLALRAESIPRAARYRTAGRGITSPEPGRSDTPHWVTSEDEARQAVRDEAARGVDIIKIWVDDRNGQYEKLSPELYTAVIDEAHRNDLKVTAHIFTLEDAKGLLEAGVDAFAHGVRDRDIDDELVELLRERPDVVLVPNLPSRGMPTDLSWLEAHLPADDYARVEEANTERPEVQEAFGIQARNLNRLHEAGMRIAFGTDGNTFWAPHVEMEDMVAAGMSPGDVIVAATRNSAELMGLDDAGTIEAGKRADFVVLDGNPLEDIVNTRRIVEVYLGGEAVPAPAARTAALPDGIRFVERVEKQAADDIVIPYSRYELDNGLEVILHEDHSDPLVHVDVTFHVGSAREEIGKSGFAHFFEHMLFQGSENVGDDEHFRIVSEAGGTLNGSTNTDRTNYFETVPSNQLEKVLWLEADRMGFVLPAVTERKFEIQRETVKNERGQNYDNRPYGLLGEITDEALFPPGHPYSWQTIGYIEDLDRADLDDLKKFFLRWYGPNNAVLTIGGDLDPAQTLEWVVKYFGPIPRGPDVDDPVYEPVTLDSDRYISMEDRVALPLIRMTWPTVNGFHADEAPLDVLNSILGSGRTSLLYKNLVRNGLAVNAGARHSCGELACRFTLTAQPNPANGASLADLERIMRESLDELEERGVLEDDLERMKGQIVSSNIFGLESVRGKVSNLAFFATFADTPGYTAEEIARYERVTAEDVMRVYREYIEDKPAVIVSIVPNGQADAVAAPDNVARPEREIPDYAETELALREPVDSFDRSIEPPPGDENPAIKLPEIWRGELENGIEVLGAVNTETPTTAVRIQFEAGQRREPLDKLGLASLTAQMLNEATEASTSEALSNRLQKLGSSVNVGAGERFTTVTVRSLSENLAETIEIAAERLFTPAFSDEDFARVKDQTLQSIEQSKTQAATVADNAFNLLLYGRDNSFAYPAIGLAETVAGITLDDVRAFYERTYSPATASVVTVTDLPRSRMIDALSILTSWSGEAPSESENEALPELAAGTLYLIDKPSAAQSEIRVGKRALPYDATGEYHRAQLMNYPLGGAFSSRINLNLREDKGFTYGARSGFSGNDRHGLFVASTGVRTDATAASVVELVSEIEGYAAGGITTEELAFTQRAIGQADARSYETPGQKLGILSNIVTYDLPEDFIDVQNRILAEIGEPEIDALAAEHLAIEDMIVVVVGDKAAILPELEALEFPIVELDEDARPL